MFETDEFYALRTGFAPRIGGESNGSGIDLELRISQLGRLRVTSGRVAAGSPRKLADPIPGDDRHESIAVFGPVEAGLHEVWLTLAAHSDDEAGLPAYLSLLFDDSPTATIEPWIAEGDTAAPGHPADSFVYVDDSLLEVMDADTADDDAVAAVGEHLLHTQTAACIAPLPASVVDDKVVVCRAKQGTYPVVATRNARGEVTGLHIDFAIVGPRSRKDWWKARHIHAHP
ncbi:hypothetical protein IU479_30815 [Nocardia abscessus]|uniref:hypothetical protein n=1 Tax=Nocardia TaxID=1817 RepID=UPI001893093F|nr:MULTISPECIES: hypothetical protein [Nocardia]MBF6222490.1 hypothetical protein [Nocardia abscessus]